MSDAAPRTVIQVGLSAVLVGLGIYDCVRGRVPNVVVMPLLLSAIAADLVRIVGGELALGQAVLIVTIWLTCLALWSLGVFGGGDMKLTMALVGLFPDDRLVIILLAIVLVGLVAMLLIQDGQDGLRRLGALLFTALHGYMPTPGEIQTARRTRRSRATFLISLAGLIYLWGVL